jgi:hypothetical protein
MPITSIFRWPVPSRSAGLAANATASMGYHGCSMQGKRQSLRDTVARPGTSSPCSIQLLMGETGSVGNELQEVSDG